MEVLHISCNMGTPDLPDMYVCPKPEGRGHTYQANHSCPCYNYVNDIPRTAFQTELEIKYPLVSAGVGGVG